jgi:SAM-dependent methyltransferase
MTQTVTAPGWQHVLGLAFAGSPCVVHGLAPLPTALPVARWCDGADDSDRAVLDHCVGAVLDLGCGPGRMAHELSGRGHRVVGVDVLPEAIELTRSRGVEALHRDVFTELPGEGTWQSVLLADGNIGIGGDPVALLRRVASLLCAGGRAVVDVEGPGVGVRRCSIRLEAGGVASEPLRWAVVGVDRIAELGAAAGLTLVHAGTHVGARGRRWFAVLEKSQEAA